jgi:shikimate dehydrogenase
MIRPVPKDLYAVIGNPVAHSLSPVMMNAVFEALKIPALYFALQVDDPGVDLVTLARLGIKGLSVTIPHKEAACRLAECVDEAAQTMGAVNTLRLDETRWQGQNTDWIGAISALRQEMDHFDSAHRAKISLADHAHAPRQANAPAHHAGVRHQPFIAGKRALVIGAGGVARAVIYGLRREGAAVTISNRGVSRGENLAKGFACDFIPLSELSVESSRTAFDIIVQCTSVGLMDKEDFTLIPDALFHPGSIVMDTVYRPLWTPFLRKAKAADCITVSGVEMLLHQGAAQLEWWLGELIRSEMVVPIMREAVTGFLEDE